MARILALSDKTDLHAFDMISSLANLSLSREDIAAHVLYLSAESYLITALPHLNVILPAGKHMGYRADIVSALIYITASHFLIGTVTPLKKGEKRSTEQTRGDMLAPERDIKSEAIGDVRIEYESPTVVPETHIKSVADWFKKQGDALLDSLGGSPGKSYNVKVTADALPSQLLI